MGNARSHTASAYTVTPADTSRCSIIIISCNECNNDRTEESRVRRESVDSHNWNLTGWVDSLRGRSRASQTSSVCSVHLDSESSADTHRVDVGSGRSDTASANAVTPADTSL